jgi:hypothetical protein
MVQLKHMTTTAIDNDNNDNNNINERKRRDIAISFTPEEKATTRQAIRLMLERNNLTPAERGRFERLAAADTTTNDTMHFVGGSNFPSIHLSTFE